MKAESAIKPEKFRIENRENGKVAVYFFTNIEESIKDEQKLYSYDMYVIETKKQDNLKERIENNYDMWLDFVKQKEYDRLAEEIRTKRNKLLEETDKEMALDRLKLNMPEDITMTNIVSGIKEFFTSFKEIFNSDIAKYRQDLRDIPQQEGFPYNVIWPTKAEKADEEE